MRGYKVFNPDWTCRGFQYAVGETFEEDINPEVCEQGFHFCLNLADCFSYYSFNPENKVAEVEALGDIDTNNDGSKSCTNKIEIVRELTWEEVLRLVNAGKGCSGLCNSGDRNSGDHNSGNWNSGDHNIGNWNSGNRNSGDHNIGNWNSGHGNSGNGNSGNGNSGSRNIGNYNSGNYNSGDWNSGNHNSGDWNSGNCNIGYRNSGDWNKTNFSSGCFNTKESKILMFNKPSDWTYQDWLISDAKYLLNKIQHNVLSWIREDDMTDEEKEQHPEYETTGGYLKELDESECGQIWWNSLSDHEKDVIKALPNFDAEIFEQITGVNIDD